MKQLFLLLAACCMLLTACQKSVSFDSFGNGTETDKDSILRPGDIVMYEVVTSDSLGWFGAWNDSTGRLVSGKLDSVTYGKPIFFPSGWTYTFTCPNKPFQALISVDAARFQDDITVNLYKNGCLVKSSTNNPIAGFAKLLVTAQADSLTGTSVNPVVTYEVLVTDPDTSKFQSDCWLGQWTEADGLGSTTLIDDSGNNYINSLLFLFGMPSGWRRSFRPDRLPFNMRMFANPYTEHGGTVMVNFYVNGILVKSGSSGAINFISEYTVQ